jgi:hypothetical protein
LAINQEAILLYKKEDFSQNIAMAKKKEWREGEMILTFKLSKIDTSYTALMTEWMTVENPVFTAIEQHNFDTTYHRGVKKIKTWSEEDLKMKFISHILELGLIMEDENFTSFFDKKLAAKVDSYELSVKADFVVAKGYLDYMERPFFHFQEYKPQKNPTGDPMAQLLEAFLIGQALNSDKKPLYGCEVIGTIWTFCIMEARTYCISKQFDATDRNDLLQIIAILRKFKEILESKLL